MITTGLIVKRNNFSIWKYILIVFAVSWPFQFFVFFYPDANWAFKMLLVSMIMVTVGTFIAGKYIFKDSFKNAGWSWGKPKHYFLAIGLPLIIWVLPTLVQTIVGLQKLPLTFSLNSLILMFFLSFATTLIPAFGEEFGWRGYLLPKLVLKHSIKKALLIQAFIWWSWHIPFIVFMGISAPLIEGNTLLSVLMILGISIIPSMMHAVIFFFIWSISSSLAVVTIYHAMFDEVRDSLIDSVGLSSITDLWQMIIITILGITLLLKGRWKNLKAIKEKADIINN